MGKYVNVVSYNPTTTLTDTSEPMYFIVGRCLNGSRHYSENMCFSKVVKNVDKYRSVVDYFGGGTVDVYRTTGTKIYSDVVMDFDF